MKIGPSLAPTNPFHVSRVYGAPAPARIQPAAPLGSAAATRIDQLVGARVPGGIEFGHDGVPQVGLGQRPIDSFQMYRHPADKNAAATAVMLGRVLDING